MGPMEISRETRMELVRAMKPEGRTVEGLKAHAEKLLPHIDRIDPRGTDEE